MAIAISLLAWSRPAACEESVHSRDLSIKGAFIFYLSRFVAWPAERNEPPISPYIFCVFDDAVFKKHLDEELRGRTIRGMPIVVKGYSASEVDRDFRPACDIAYFDRDNAETFELLDSLSRDSVLTIGDSEAFLEKGGIIRIFEKSNKTRFIINMSSARRARLQFTAEILDLAEAVIYRNEDGKNRAVQSPAPESNK